MSTRQPSYLAQSAPDLERTLTVGSDPRTVFAASEIRRETVRIPMRDDVRLSTDFYFPPLAAAPAIAVRTPYGRAQPKFVEAFMGLVTRGYIVIAQDCRGTGDSEPDSWDYYVFEREDSFDFVDWVTRQSWFDGFLGACGSSYLAQTQWCMAFHPKMSVIAPEVGGLGIAYHSAHLYMFLNAYARSVGKGADKVPVAFQDLERQMIDETLAGGYFNEPLHKVLPDGLLERYPQLRALSPPWAQHWLWNYYCRLGPAERAELIKQALNETNVTISSVESLPAIFGHHIAHDAHMFPCADPRELCRSVHAPALMITGWYDWTLNDALATWELLMREANENVRSRSRLLITPSAHNTPGYHEGRADSPELERNFRTLNIIGLLLQWYEASRHNALGSWPAVIYYLMGANRWCTSSAWPPPEAQEIELYLGADGALTQHPGGEQEPADVYTYDPENPTPTLGGSIVSYVYPPGSVDVSETQRRTDVLTYTTPRLQRGLDVVGPLRLILYASSSTADTDLCARLSDVFPDGRAIQLQNGLLRARYRKRGGPPELLEPGRIYCYEIDMWATANHFKAGHRLRLDISSADFPRFDRNTNLGGAPGRSIPARQTIHRDARYPSRLLISVLGEYPNSWPGSS